MPMRSAEWLGSSMTKSTFDELMSPLSAYDVIHEREPRHLSRADLRRWRRNSWLREFDTQLAIGGLVSAVLVTFLFVLGVVVSL